MLFILGDVWCDFVFIIIFKFPCQYFRVHYNCRKIASGDWWLHNIAVVCWWRRVHERNKRREIDRWGDRQVDRMIDRTESKEGIWGPVQHIESGYHPITNFILNTLNIDTCEQWAQQVASLLGPAAHMKAACGSLSCPWKRHRPSCQRHHKRPAKASIIKGCDIRNTFLKNHNFHCFHKKNHSTFPNWYFDLQ